VNLAVATIWVVLLDVFCSCVRDILAVASKSQRGRQIVLQRLYAATHMYSVFDFSEYR